MTLGPFLGFHCYVFALSDVFRKGCLAVCFLLWRLFDCSSTTAAPQQQQEQPPVAAPAAGSSRQQQAASSFCQQHAAAGSSRQQQAAAGSSRQQQAAAGSSQQQPAAGRSRQQQAAAGSRQQQAAAKFQFYSRVSEVTLGPFCGSAFNAAARVRMAAWTVATWHALQTRVPCWPRPAQGGARQGIRHFPPTIWKLATAAATAAAAGSSRQQ